MPIFVAIVSLMSLLCDCADRFQTGVGGPGYPCSAPSDCQPGYFTNTRHCCGGPPNGKYCSDCCVDNDCGPGHICIPYNWFWAPGFGATENTHIRVCIPSKTDGSSEPCFRNEQCISMRCNGGLGYSGDKVKLPPGKCA